MSMEELEVALVDTNKKLEFAPDESGLSDKSVIPKEESESQHSEEVFLINAFNRCN